MGASYWSSSLWSHTTQTGEEGAEGILVTIMAMAGILDPMEATTLGQMTETEMEVGGILGLFLAMEEAIILDPIMEGVGIPDQATGMEVAGILVPIMAMEEVGIRDPGPVDQVACCCHVHMC